MTDSDFEKRETECVRRDGETPDEAGCHCIVCENWRQERKHDSLSEKFERVLREKQAESDVSQPGLDAFAGGDES